MSRVYEALKRASPERFENPAGSTSSPTHATDRPILEWYAVEGRPVSRNPGPQDRPSVVVSSPQRPLRTFSPSLEGKLVVSKEIAALSVEQYRRVAAVLQDHQGARGLKKLMVSSAVADEGKTLTVCNLALTLSESYRRRVLLVDADLRHPSIHHVFGLACGTGLSDDLRSARSALSMVQVSQNLSVLPAGQVGADPMAELSSDRMQTLIQEAASQFDWVLVDTPPVCLLADVHLVARATDAVLLVIGARTTPYQLVEHAIAELGSDRIIGTVLNRMDDHALAAKHYYSHRYHQSGANGLAQDST